MNKGKEDGLWTGVDCPKPLFLAGLISEAKKMGLGVEEVAARAIAACRTQDGEENIPEIEAALRWILDQEEQLTE